MPRKYLFIAISFYRNIVRVWFAIRPFETHLSKIYPNLKPKRDLIKYDTYNKGEGVGSEKFHVLFESCPTYISDMQFDKT